MNTTQNLCQTRTLMEPHGRRHTGPKKSKTDIAIEQAAARLAAQAPPLSEGQRRRIAELFAPAISAIKR